VPSCTSFVAGCQALAHFFRSLFATMVDSTLESIQTGRIKNPDFGCRQKTGIGLKFASNGLLATCLTWLQAGRPNHHGAINAPAERFPSSLCQRQPAETAKRKEMTSSAPSRVRTPRRSRSISALL
jgi:hypothetical protein